MTTASRPAPSQPQPSSSALGRKPRFWSFFRLFAGLGGATLVLIPVASGNSYIYSVVGLALFLAAILLLPTQPRTTFDDKARELGAHLVVDGGRYHLPNSTSFVPVQLFLSVDRVSALDSGLRVLVEIPAAEITSFLALQSGKGWFLEVIWSTHAAEFAYRGASAERLAQIAENAIRKVAPAPGPVVPQSRAAGV